MELEKRKIITLCGRPGSGKSSTAKGVAAALGYQHFSSGDLFRALGKERGIDVLQTNLTAEQNSEIDRMVDERLQSIGRTEERIVIDSRTAWHWIPQSFKVFLDLDLQIAAGRILGDKDDARTASETMHADPAAYAEQLRQRLDSESRRYKALYDIDPYQLDHYDLVINTAENSLEQTVQKVLDAYRIWIQQSGQHV